MGKEEDRRVWRERRAKGKGLRVEGGRDPLAQIFCDHGI